MKNNILDEEQTRSDEETCLIYSGTSYHRLSCDDYEKLAKDLSLKHNFFSNIKRDIFVKNNNNNDSLQFIQDGILSKFESNHLAHIVRLHHIDAYNQDLYISTLTSNINEYCDLHLPEYKKYCSQISASRKLELSGNKLYTFYQLALIDSNSSLP